MSRLGQILAHSRARLYRREALLLGLLLFSLLWVAFPPALKVAWVVLAAGAFFSFCMIQRLEGHETRWLRGFFLLSLLARVAVALALYVVSPRVWIQAPLGPFQNGGFLVGDGYAYAENGYWLAKHWGNREFPTSQFLNWVSVSGATASFDYFNGLLIYWLGFHPLTLAFINCLWGAFSGVLVYWIGRRFLSQRQAKVAAVLTAFWPSLFLWSTQNLKEPLTVMLLLFALALFVVPSGPIRWLAWPCGLAVSWCLRSFSPFFGSLWMLCLFLFAFFFAVARFRLLRWLLLFVLLLGLTPAFSGKLLAPFLKVSQPIFHHSLIASSSFEPDKLVGLIEYLRRVRMNDSRTPFFPQIRLDSLPSVFAFLPVGLGGALLFPTPWGSRSPGELMGSAEMLLWYPLFFFALRGVARASVGSSTTRLILLAALVMLSAIALLEGNVGTLFRHRAPVWPLLLLLAALGLGRPLKPEPAVR